MKKLILLTLLPSAIFAQVGINTNTPTSTLDITAKASTGTTTNVDGMLIPRINLQRAQLMSAVPTSTLIYVNDLSVGTAAGIAADVTSTGFYYFDGTKWVAAITSNNNNDWHLIGNTGTNPANNFIGTSDNQPVVFKINNANAGALGTAPFFNTSFGLSTFAYNITGPFNVAFGFQALRINTTGNRNTAIGVSALNSNILGNQNTAVGYESLTNSTAGTNTGIGYFALRPLTTGTENIGIGYQAGLDSNAGGTAAGITTGSRNLMLGINTGVPNQAANDQMNIGNIIFGTNINGTLATPKGNVGIGISDPTTRLHVVATTANANRYNLFDATSGTNQYGILTLRNTSPLATGNYSLLGFTNSGPTSGGGNWALGSIRTGATAVNGSEEDFYIGNSTGGALTERLRIKPDTGFVGIGTTTPTARVEIASGATGTSGLKFTNINNTTATTQNAAALGVDATGNVVIQNNAPLTSTFKSFSINASSAANSLITIGSLQFQYPATSCTVGPTYIQVRSTSGASNIGIMHAAMTSSQTQASNAFIATAPLTATTAFTDITSLPLNCIQDSHAQFNFYSYTDRTFYRVNVNIADGDSLGFGALGYIFVELQR
ncbi:hypothetical protein [Chryseobacterium sp. SIMBA_038]|uniref:hypothetical protein n=1 Tax=Chryseobacterium sp. SIMBA_038 TaxID=3085780 RepID=UPI00397DE4B7